MKPSAYSAGEAVALSAAPSASTIDQVLHAGSCRRGEWARVEDKCILPRSGDLDYISRSIYIIQDMK